MSKLQVQFFILALIATAIGASLIAGWGNAIAAGGVGILAGRRAARPQTDPRLGKLAGLGIGLWVGLGAAAGQSVASILAAVASNAVVTIGLVIILSLLSFGVAMLAATLAGREAVQVPEEEG